MADKDKETVEVPLKVLTELQERMAEQDRKIAEMEANGKGMEELFKAQNKADGVKEETGLREKKTFEPKFRTLRLRKYPMGNPDSNDMQYVIGWTNRGAYQSIDRTSGVSAQVVDNLDVIFLGHERDAKGVLEAQQVPLLGTNGFLVKGVPVHCRILEVKIEPEKVPTGEEISVTVFDPAHGLVSTGEVVDGYTAYSNRKYLIKIPDREEPIWVDEEFVNK